MKKHLLTLLTLLTTLVVSCSKNADIASDKKTSLGNDTLITRLNLKIQDKSNLTVKNQIFTTSSGQVLISGIKDGNFWLGLFDKTGIELVTKKFDQDPTEKGKEYFYNLFSIREGTSDIFITRQIRPGNSLDPFATLFDEGNTKINMIDYSVTVSYNKFSVEAEQGFTSYFSEWQKGTYALTTSKTNRFGEILNSTTTIFDKSGRKTKTLSGHYFTKQHRYVPISSKYVLEITSYGAINLLIINDDQITKEDIYNTDKNFKLISKNLSNGILSIIYSIKSENEDIMELKINEKTGIVIW